MHYPCLKRSYVMTIVGVPTEVIPYEYRVSMRPIGARFGCGFEAEPHNLPFRPIGV
jgi:hypothetical protein